MAEYLSEPFVKADFDFFLGVLSGQKEQKPRWKRRARPACWKESCETSSRAQRVLLARRAERPRLADACACAGAAQLPDEGERVPP